MKKYLSLSMLIIFLTTSCEKQKVWEYTLLPKTCFADAIYVKPDFKPNGFNLTIKGTLNQDVIVTLLGTQPINDYSTVRYVGLNNFQKLKAGPLNFSHSADMYTDDLKIIISGSDTTLYPNPESKGTVKGMPLGDVKIRITLN